LKCRRCESENPDDARYCSACGASLADELTETRTLSPITVPKPGRVVAGKYEILEELGRGGMSRVYSARDKTLERTVALKFLSPELTGDREARARFMNEAQAASALDHPNICTVFEIGEIPGQQMYISMACYDGRTLRERIDQGMMQLEEVLEVAVPLCRGLASAHSKQLVHRDIKPQNVFLTRDSQVKILDFGLTKLAGSRRDPEKGTGGTVLYMSPEQTQGLEVDQRTDIWSVGVVLYEMLTGELPFKGDRIQMVMYSINNTEPEPVSSLRRVPPMLERIVGKALSKDPDARYKDCDYLIKDLTAARSQLGKYEVEIEPEESETRDTQASPLAVISFENQTGDAGYDYLQKAIPNLLITKLEQSPYLKVMTWERMQDLLRQSGKPGIDVIGKEFGFELCRKEQIPTIVLGSFTKAGSMFATDVKVLDVETNDLLKSASSRGEGINSILQKQIDELSGEISNGLGILDRSTRATGLPIAEASTASMEAYKLFLQGREAHDKLYNTEAKHLLERALELDPEFALSHLYLAFVHDRLRDLNAEQEAYEKAIRFSVKATEKNRLLIEAAYARAVEQDADKWFDILNQIIGKYPYEKRIRQQLAAHHRARGRLYQALEEYNRALELDPQFGLAMNELGYMYADIGDFEKAREYFERYASACPGDANPVDSMGELFFRQGRLDEAIAKYEETLSLKPDFFYAHWELSYVYALKEDYDRAFHWVDRFIMQAPSTGVKASGLWSFPKNLMGQRGQVASMKVQTPIERRTAF
jgi:serine/threonine protein kinase